MIRPVIDSHIGAARHMALDAFSPGPHFKQDLSFCRFNGLPFLALSLVKMMFLGVIFVCAVALEAKAVSLFNDLHTVHVMAVAAAHIPVVHLALGERTVYVDLLQNLSIRKIHGRC